MFNLEAIIDLPFAWYILIAAAVFLYVVLDGFDLGLGILFPLAPTDGCRDRMMASIAPFWDGNETWLVLGGGGLFAAFLLNSVTKPGALRGGSGMPPSASARFWPPSARGPFWAALSRACRLTDVPTAAALLTGWGRSAS